MAKVGRFSTLVTWWNVSYDEHDEGGNLDAYIYTTIPEESPPNLP